MTITVKLYGKLKERVNDINMEKGLPATLHIEIGNLKAIFDILTKLKIEEKEISHIFLNGVYTGAGIKIKNGDRIGIFPTNMALMFAEIPDINSIHIKVKFFADLKEEGKHELRLKIPKNSTLKSIIKKLRLPNDKTNYRILVNGIQLVNDNSLIYLNDRLEILPYI